jgi:hypothetical protein
MLQQPSSNQMEMLAISHLFLMDVAFGFLSDEASLIGH